MVFSAFENGGVFLLFAFTVFRKLMVVNPGVLEVLCVQTVAPWRVTNGELVLRHLRESPSVSSSYTVPPSLRR